MPQKISEIMNLVIVMGFGCHSEREKWKKRTNQNRWYQILTFEFCIILNRFRKSIKCFKLITLELYVSLCLTSDRRFRRTTLARLESSCGENYSSHIIARTITIIFIFIFSHLCDSTVNMAARPRSGRVDARPCSLDLSSNRSEMERKVKAFPPIF